MTIYPKHSQHIQIHRKPYIIFLLRAYALGTVDECISYPFQQTVNRLDVLSKSISEDICDFQHRIR